MKQTNQLSIFSNPPIARLEKKENINFKNSVSSLLIEIKNINSNNHQIGSIYYKELEKCNSNQLYSVDELKKEIINLREWVRIFSNISPVIANTNTFQLCKNILIQLYKK